MMLETLTGNSENLVGHHEELGLPPKNILAIGGY